MADYRLDEEATRRKLVNTALAQAGWSPSQIGEEVGTERIRRDGTREAGRADYVLYVRVNRKKQPVAVLEAKSESHDPIEGAEQAAEYARALSVPVAFSTNGRYYVEVDPNSSEVSAHRPMETFPTPKELSADSAEASETEDVREPMETFPSPKEPSMDSAEASESKEAREPRVSDNPVVDGQVGVVENREMRRTRVDVHAQVFSAWQTNNREQSQRSLGDLAEARHERRRQRRQGRRNTREGD